MNLRLTPGRVRGIVVAAVAVAGVLLAWGAYGYFRPVVTVTEAVEGPVVEAFYATGTVSPEWEHPVRSNVEGTLTEVHVTKGARVEEGDVLAVVTDPELEFLLQQAQAEVEEKRARADEEASPVLAEFTERLVLTEEMLKLAKGEQERLVGLQDEEAATQMDVDRAADRVSLLKRDAVSIRAQKAAMRLELQKELRVAEAALRIAEWNAQQQVLKSPVTGVVLDRPVAVGTRLAVNDHVMMVADVRPEALVMRASVDEEDVTRIRRSEGDLSAGVEPQVVRMTLYAFPDRPFDGTVRRVYEKADTERRTFEVDIEFRQPDPLFAPGMTGELAFEVAAKESALVVPRQAWQGDRLYVVRDGRIEAADVKVGLKSVERLEIVSGVEPGDRVVISPIGKLTAGQRVRTTELPPADAAALNAPEQAAPWQGAK